MVAVWEKKIDTERHRVTEFGINGMEVHLIQTVRVKDEPLAPTYARNIHHDHVIILSTLELDQLVATHTQEREQ